MKLIECNTINELGDYIGESTSWERALRTSKRKWEERIGRANNLCGFCFVIKNITGSRACELCPIDITCDSLSHEGAYLYPDRVIALKLFNSPELKTLIANSKPGQTFTSGEKL